MVVSTNHFLNLSLHLESGRQLPSYARKILDTLLVQEFGDVGAGSIALSPEGVAASYGDGVLLHLLVLAGA